MPFNLKIHKQSDALVLLELLDRWISTHRFDENTQFLHQLADDLRLLVRKPASSWVNNNRPIDGTFTCGHCHQRILSALMDTHIPECRAKTARMLEELPERLRALARGDHNNE